MTAGNRASWTDSWKAVATAVALRSRCVKRQVGAVAVSADNRDHWVGYNGPPAGLWPPQDPSKRDCGSFCPQGSVIRPVTFGPLDRPEEPPCASIHAEMNAILACTDPLRLEAGTFFVTAAPCWKCALAIAQTRVAVLVCPPYEGSRGALGLRVESVLAQAGVSTFPW